MAPTELAARDDCQQHRAEQKLKRREPGTWVRLGIQRKKVAQADEIAIA
jgi:hypothetical protein